MQDTLIYRPVSHPSGAQALFCRHLEQCYERKSYMQNCQALKYAEGGLAARLRRCLGYFTTARLCSGCKTVLDPAAVIMPRKASVFLADLLVSPKAG